MSIAKTARLRAIPPVNKIQQEPTYPLTNRESCHKAAKTNSGVEVHRVATTLWLVRHG